MLLEPKRVNAPICVVANGASLDSLIPFIKENQKHMIIFSCGTALKPLMKNGIKPDFQVEIERHDYLDSALKEAPLDDVPLLCASVLDKKAKDLAKEIYMFERDGSSAANLNAPKFRVKFTAPLVGNAGAALAAYLGSDVLLCGIDCGYKKGRKEHASNSYYGDEKPKEIPSDAYLVVGNFSDDIYSNALYSLSRSALEDAFRALKPFNILNLSDGARILGAEPVRYDEFVLRVIDKDEILRQIKSLFKDPYENNFYTKDTQLHLIEINAFKARILDLFKKPLHSKQGLFKAVDEIFKEISKINIESPFTAILFGGSLSHFLYALVLAALHLPHNNMEALWEEAQRLYIKAMDSMLESLKEVLFKKVEH
ncbi:MAG: 6-hydroxymethylpterin diphosphokinase MptE-like protein [Helicobacter sp.]|nr:6-hydroxymethylpterin diphosphokinase MptE-like protein [Helicobacter sp.]